MVDCTFLRRVSGSIRIKYIPRIHEMECGSNRPHSAIVNRPIINHSEMFQSEISRSAEHTTAGALYRILIHHHGMARLLGNVMTMLMLLIDVVYITQTEVTSVSGNSCSVMHHCRLRRCSVVQAIGMNSAGHFLSNGQLVTWSRHSYYGTNFKVQICQHNLSLSTDTKCKSSNHNSL
jgi:hypothetical protein